MEIEQRIYSVIDELSQRNTRPRRLIADQLIALSKTGVDFSTDELWQHLRVEDAGIGRATVFRTIEKLVDKNILDRIDFADGTHRYRVCGTHHHHHMTCTQCHRVFEFDFCLPAEQIAQIGRQQGFKVEGHALTLFGRCAACQKLCP
jgi:Fe2+/Zn2+ uptake regulation proteins